MTTSRQSWDPDQYRTNAGFVAELGAPLVEILAPKPGERVLDLGCGDGRLTRKLAELGCRVIGVDSSSEQVAAAREAGLDARVMSGDALTFHQQFDAVFSNAALHWMLDADAVLRGVRRALRPGGRFVAEMGGAGNVQAVIDAFEAVLADLHIDANTHNPWYFPTPDAYRQRLEGHDFAVRDISLFNRPTPIPGDIWAWVETFGQAFLSAVPSRDLPFIRERLRENLAPALRQADGSWSVDYVRLRFVAYRGEDD